MAAKSNTGFRVSILTLVCTATVFSLVGCQSAGEMSVSPTNPQCPLCGGPTQPTPTAGLSCMRMVCPLCGQVEAVATLDQDFLDRLEVFTGGPVGDTVYACAMCKTAVAQCAACRQKGSPATSRDIHSRQ
jgi:hypothetical protein